jgi:hypothetical protein
MRHQISARVPDDTYELLRALVSVTGEAQAEVLAKGLVALEKTLTSEQRRLVQGLMLHRKKT